MVFRGLCYQLDLPVIEPFFQTGVSSYDFSGIGVMVLLPVYPSEVMAGSSGDKYFRVYR